MKTMTTLAAVAALLAGISLASAQTSTMGQSGAKTKAMGTGAYCLSGKNGAQNCTFASLDACQKMAKSGENCAANPKSATTGSK